MTEFLWKRQKLGFWLVGTTNSYQNKMPNKIQSAVAVYMREYNAESPKQLRRRFNSQVRRNTLTIWEYHLSIYASVDQVLLTWDLNFFCALSVPFWFFLSKIRISVKSNLGSPKKPPMKHLWTSHDRPRNTLPFCVSTHFKRQCHKIFKNLFISGIEPT